jgi:leucyl aminopeptidase (aminopeptidase T)
MGWKEVMSPIQLDRHEQSEPPSVEHLFGTDAAGRDIFSRMIKVCERVCALWEETDVCQVTSPLGTDISFQLKGRPGVVGDGMATEPGEVDFFPGVDATIAPIEKTINGTVVVDAAWCRVGWSARPSPYTWRRVSLPRWRVGQTPMPGVPAWSQLAILRRSTYVTFLSG